MIISDAIILVTWIGCNLQTRNKITNRYPIPDSAATILISNIVRVCYARYVRLKKDTIMAVRDLDTIYRLDREWIPDFVSQVLYGLLTQLFQICWGDIRIEFLASSWWSRDLITIYRPDRRWASDVVSQFLYGVLTQALPDMLGWQKNYIHHIIMMVTSSLYKIYRLDWKCFLDLVSQVLHALLT